MKVNKQFFGGDKMTAVVAVRKGSQRIPNKNITPFGHSNLLEMKLTEGKNREIRKIMKNFSLTIKKLKRIKYGPLALGSLKPGETKEITKKNIFSFFKFVNFKDENNFWQI